MNVLTVMNRIKAQGLRRSEAKLFELIDQAHKDIALDLMVPRGFWETDPEAGSFMVPSVFEPIGIISIAPVFNNRQGQQLPKYGLDYVNVNYPNWSTLPRKNTPDFVIHDLSNPSARITPVPQPIAPISYRIEGIEKMMPLTGLTSELFVSAQGFVINELRGSEMMIAYRILGENLENSGKWDREYFKIFSRVKEGSSVRLPRFRNAYRLD